MIVWNDLPIKASVWNTCIMLHADNSFTLIDRNMSKTKLTLSEIEYLHRGMDRMINLAKYRNLR